MMICLLPIPEAEIAPTTLKGPPPAECMTQRAKNAKRWGHSQVAAVISKRQRLAAHASLKRRKTGGSSAATSE